MTDTPITDEAEDRCASCGLNFVLADDARKLERTNADLLAALDDLLHIFTDIPASRNYGQLVQSTRAAIARAKGEA